LSNLAVKKSTQRKNTSDSNMKLLADHNFYHISNKRSNEFSNLNYKNGHLISNNDIYENNNNNKLNNLKYGSSSSSSRPYELTDFFNNKYNKRGGMNSSSNSLVSLNESSPSPINEEIIQFNTSTDRDLIRSSNPDLNNDTSQVLKKIIFNNSPKTTNNNNHNLTRSPVNGTSTSNKLINHKRLETQTSDFHLNKNNNNNNNKNNDINNYSNNASLNLSIHTAEEFSIEMLSWLKNETNNNNSIKKIISEENLDLIDNATLV
jgi:hypothetical protein